MHGRDQKPIVPDFTIIVDCREQRPYEFVRMSLPGRNNRLVHCKSQIGYLTAGDYSLLGMESEVAIERKSKVDLFGTLGKGRERFKKEMEKLNAMNWSAVVVESQFSSILSRPPEYSEMNPNAVEATIVSWSVRYPNVHWFTCMNRQHAEAVVFRLLEKYWTLAGKDSGNG